MSMLDDCGLSNNVLFRLFAGASEIGVLFSYVLFGVMTTQTYIYYSRFPDDSRKLKALVRKQQNREDITEFLA
jgi:hypothetical protein